MRGVDWVRRAGVGTGLLLVGGLLSGGVPPASAQSLRATQPFHAYTHCDGSQKSITIPLPAAGAKIRRHELVSMLTGDHNIGQGLLTIWLATATGTSLGYPAWVPVRFETRVETFPLPIVAPAGSALTMIWQCHGGGGSHLYVTVWYES